jgi:hypothetical protein
VYSDFYKIPLPALRFEKVEENSQKVNDTKENYARPRQKQETEKRREGRHTTIKDASENDTQTKAHTLLEQRNADRKQTSTKAFKIKTIRNPE